tara:strand:+ start:305 stop:577 length:273 start_codon:yes stop_codon:yes gene_type:complete
MSKYIENTFILERVGNKLIGERFTFLICTRAKATKKKASKFLLSLKGNERNYLSSLYPTSIPDSYKFEYKGKEYTLILSKTKALLKPLSI